MHDIKCNEPIEKPHTILSGIYSTNTSRHACLCRQVFYNQGGFWQQPVRTSMYTMEFTIAYYSRYVCSMCMQPCFQTPSNTCTCTVQQSRWLSLVQTSKYTIYRTIGADLNFKINFECFFNIPWWLMEIYGNS